MRIVVIGGSDAGVSAALRARELDPSAEVHMIVADAYPNFSICGLPFFLSGEITDWKTLAHRTQAQIEETGIHLHLNETASAIDTENRCVVTQRSDGSIHRHPYDRVVIGTGAVPVRPKIEGIDLPNVFVLHSMDESFAVKPASIPGPSRLSLSERVISAWKWRTPSVTGTWRLR